MSINALDVAAALVKMSTYEYRLGNGYFIKVLLSKRYSLPTMVLDALVTFMCKTGMQDSEVEVGEYGEMDSGVKEMPVMWH